MVITGGKKSTKINLVQKAFKLNNKTGLPLVLFLKLWQFWRVKTIMKSA